MRTGTGRSSVQLGSAEVEVQALVAESRWAIPMKARGMARPAMAAMMRNLALPWGRDGALPESPMR